MATEYLKTFLTDTASENRDKLISYGIITFLAFMLILVPQLGGSYQEFTNVQTATLLLLILSLASLGAVDKRPQIYVSYGLPKRASIAMVLGAVAALVISLGAGFSIATPLSVVTGPNLLLLFYAMVIVPFAEERFFGRTLPYLFLQSGLVKDNTMNQVVSIGATAAIFAGFHFISYQADLSKMAAAFIFRVLTLVGNSALESGWFGDSAHLMNNVVLGLKQIKSLGI